MGWTLFFMLVVLKIPVVAAAWIIWYAIKQTPEPDWDGADEDRGPRRRPRPPRNPRRGPGGGAGCSRPLCPQEGGSRLTRRGPLYARRPARV